MLVACAASYATKEIVQHHSSYKLQAQQPGPTWPRMAPRVYSYYSGNNVVPKD
jgi:hypothetical protein